MARRGRRRFWGPPRPRGEEGGGAPPVVITVSPSDVADGQAGVVYSEALSASGGTGPYTFAVTSGTLPAGLSLSSAGVLSGTPALAGDSSFTVTATDAGSHTGSRAYSMTIAAAAVVGAALLLVGETDGSAIDFIYPVDAKRVAKKVGGTVTEYGADGLLVNTSGAARQVWDVAGTLVWSPHNMFLNSGVPVTQNVTLVVGQNYTMTVTGSGSLAGTSGASGTATAGVPATFVATGTTGTFTKTGTLATMQLNKGAIATAYLPTTAAARIGLPLDHDPVTHVPKGLLQEATATNLLLQSSAFDNASWGKFAGTVAANAVAAPNGGTEGDAFIPNSGSVLAYLQQAITSVAATAYTFSMYAKAGTLSGVWLEFAVISTTTWRVWFNLATGAKGTSVGSPTSYNITSVGNGWYRCDITVTAGTTTLTAYPTAAPADGSTGNVTGDGTSPAFYLWGAQLETGAFASSPVPTFTASAQRLIDRPAFVTSTIPWNDAASTIYCEHMIRSTATAGMFWEIALDVSNRVTVINSTGTMRLQNTTTGGGGDVLFNFGSAIVPNVVEKSTVGVQANNFAASKNGSVVATDLANVLTTGYVGINLGHSTGVSSLNGWIQRFVHVPRRVTNAELPTWRYTP